MSDLILPGDPGWIPDDLLGYCQLCDQPAERQQFDLMDANRRMGISASCCGQTSSTWIDHSVYLQMKATGARLYVIVRKGSQAGLRMRARQNLRAV